MDIQLKNIFLTVHLEQEDGLQDEKNCNTDVIALMEEVDEVGRLMLVKYVASFFTYDNVAVLKAQNMAAGEFLNGLYFYAQNMVLIEQCNRECVEKVVKHLLEEGEFKVVFRRLS